MRLKNLFGILFAFLGLSVLSPQSSLHAAFEDKGTGARATALGDTYVALGDDVLSLAYNPAGLARVQQKEVTSEYAKLYAGLSDGSNLSQTYLGYGQPISWGGTLAISWKQFSLDDLYKERTLSLGYGEWLTPTVAIGGALKQLYHSFGVSNMIVDNNGNVRSGTPNFFAQNGNSQTTYSADLGMLYRMTEKHTLGISIQDINEPNVALSPADHEIVPRTVRIGMGYERTKHLNFAAALQTRQSLDNQTDKILTGATERTWDLDGGDQVAMRGSIANGSREFRQVSLGGGYRLGALQMDYAFVFNLGGIEIGDTSGTHRVSFTYRFGPVGVPAKTPHQKAKAKQRKEVEMPNGYETTTQSGQPQRRTSPAKPLPRAAEISISPEDIDDTNTPVKAADISIDVIFDSDFDGVADDHDLCPNTPPGVEVDANGCAAAQVDHHGNPLPREVSVDFIRLDEVENGR